MLDDEDRLTAKLAALGLVVCLLGATALGIWGFFWRSAVKAGDTWVDRKVLETSHQYQQSRRSELSTYEAEIVGLEQALNDPGTPDDEKPALRAQVATIRARLRAAEGRN